VNNTVYFSDTEIKKEKKEEELGKVNQTENKRSK